MQNVSNLFMQIVSGDYAVETRLFIMDSEGTERLVGRDLLRSVSVPDALFPSETELIGNAMSAEIEIEMAKPDWTPARMARIRRQIRVFNETQESEWIPKGVFYIDTRETAKSTQRLETLNIHGYDAMLKAEEDFPDGQWATRTDYNCLLAICQKLGWQMDSETESYFANVPAFSIPQPDGYSCREVLQSIAAMRCGNFIMDEEGKLRFVGLISAPPETYYLICACRNGSERD